MVGDALHIGVGCLRRDFVQRNDALSTNMLNEQVLHEALARL